MPFDISLIHFWLCDTDINICVLKIRSHNLLSSPVAVLQWNICLPWALMKDLQGWAFIWTNVCITLKVWSYEGFPSYLLHLKSLLLAVFNSLYSMFDLYGTYMMMWPCWVINVTLPCLQVAQSCWFVYHVCTNVTQALWSISICIYSFGGTYSGGK